VDDSRFERQPVHVTVEQMLAFIRLIIKTKIRRNQQILTRRVIKKNAARFNFEMKLKRQSVASFEKCFFQLAGLIYETFLKIAPANGGSVMLIDH